MCQLRIESGGLRKRGNPAVKFAIIGAGAIGGYLGAKLALAGDDVTLHRARRQPAGASQDHGIKLIAADGSEQVARNVRATNDYRAAGAHDVVVLAMKAHQLDAVADDVQHLFGAAHGDRADAKRHPVLVLPQARRAVRRTTGCTAWTRAAASVAQIPAERVIGCVVYPACELVAPGVVRHIEGDRFPLGELDGAIERARSTRLSNAFARAGFKAPVLDNIRAEIWLKLWGNLTFNPDQRADARHAGRHLPATRRRAISRPR